MRVAALFAFGCPADRKHSKQFSRFHQSAVAKTTPDNRISEGHFPAIPREF
jgi:hypothetical protein